MSYDEYRQIMYKRHVHGVKACPCCGGEAYFGIVSGGVFACQCPDCQLVGKRIELPTYWGKGSKRMFARMFNRALKPWNMRVSERTV